MHVVIRADASSQIGTGHIMRCLTLAHGLQSMGVILSLFTRNLPVGLLALAQKVIPNIYELPAPNQPNNSWLGMPWQEDVEACIAILENTQPIDLLVVDHYGLDANWEEAVRPYAKKILVIDDLANRNHDADILLDPNYPEDAISRYHGLLPYNCQILSGTKYVLLREEFLLRDLMARDVVRDRLLIQFGGADPENVTGFTVRALAPFLAQGVPCDVVVGNAYVHLDRLRELLMEFDFPAVQLHCGVENIALLMSKSKLAIAGGGTSVWERCCVGLPSLVMAIADNQFLHLKKLGETEAVHFVGSVDSVSPSELLELVQKYWNDIKKLERMMCAGQKLVDGKGVSRVLNSIYPDHNLQHDYNIH